MSDSPPETEDTENWPEEDIADLADLLSKYGDDDRDRDEFEHIFYRKGKILLPSSVMNRAVKKLNLEQYERIKAWVIEIKRKLEAGGEVEPIGANEETSELREKSNEIPPIQESTEPDWSTFPHLTSSDPRAAKNRVEAIRNAILSLTISEGADVLYSRFKFGEVEWAKQHYLSQREIALLENLNNYKQLDLFGDEFKESTSDCRF